MGIPKCSVDNSKELGCRLDAVRLSTTVKSSAVGWIPCSTRFNNELCSLLET